MELQTLTKLEPLQTPKMQTHSTKTHNSTETITTKLTHHPQTENQWSSHTHTHTQRERERVATCYSKLLLLVVHIQFLVQY